MDTDSCLDFRPNPNIEEEQQQHWNLEGASWYGGKLILHKPSRYTPEEQLECS